MSEGEMKVALRSPPEAARASPVRRSLHSGLSFLYLFNRFARKSAPLNTSNSLKRYENPLCDVLFVRVAEHKRKRERERERERERGKPH